MERSQLDLHVVKVELEEPDDTSYIVHATETTSVKIENIASSKSIGALM